MLGNRFRRDRDCVRERWKNGNRGKTISRMNKRTSADMKMMNHCTSKTEKLETIFYGNGKEKNELSLQQAAVYHVGS